MGSTTVLESMDLGPYMGRCRHVWARPRLFGKVTNIADYGAFVELEPFSVSNLRILAVISWPACTTSEG